MAKTVMTPERFEELLQQHPQALRRLVDTRWLDLPLGAYFPKKVARELAAAGLIKNISGVYSEYYGATTKLHDLREVIEAYVALQR